MSQLQPTRTYTQEDLERLAKRFGFQVEKAPTPPAPEHEGGQDRPEEGGAP
jgi:hypothetical protein